MDFGDDVVSAALDCHDRQAVSLWLEKNGTIQWRFSSPQPKVPRNLTAQALFHPFSVLKMVESPRAGGGGDQTCVEAELSREAEKPNFKPGSGQAEKRNKPRSREAELFPVLKTVYGEDKTGV